MSTLNKINIFTSISIPIIISVLLQFIPLTNTTGYEFSFLLSFPLFISGGLIAIVNPSLKTKFYSISVILVLPLLISLVSNIFYSLCPVGFDVLFYLVIPLPAFIIGYLWGKFIHYNVPFVRVSYFLISFQILLIFPFVEFYFLPQIYFYNPVFGYLPGTIYDQHITLSWNLILYRVLIIFIFLVLSKLKCSKKKNTYWSIVLIPVALSFWFMFAKPLLGFSTTESKIEGELTQVLNTEHFKIFTDKQIRYDTTSLKNLHEFYYQEIKSQLNLDNDITIKSYIFRNRKQKKELFGSQNADVAKPWLKQIYVDEGNFSSSLKHELVHLMAGQFGNWPFDVAANPSLIEGMAMAVENNYSDKEIDFIVKLAVQSGYKTELESLFSGLNFFGNASSKSYLFAGSFIKFLSNRYGVEKVKEVYKYNDFLSAFGKPIGTLEIEFNSYLDSLDYSANNETAKLYFGYQPLIKKICPRLAARIEREGWELYRSKNYKGAIEKFEFIFSSTGSYSSLNGILLAKTKLEDYYEALILAEENLTVYENTSYFYNLELRTIDLLVQNSDSLRALKIINDLLEQNPSINYYNEAVVRNLLLNEGVEYYSDYLLSDYEKRIILLKQFDDKYNFDSVIPILIVYCETIDEGFKVLKNILNNYELSNSREGIFAAYKLSEYFYSKCLLNEAEKYAAFASENNSYLEYNSILKENYKLIKWSLEK